MARTFIDQMVADISERAGGAMESIRNTVQTDSREVLLRRFRKGYGKLTLEETLAIRDTLGHQDAEGSPCKTCRIMAQEEFRIMKEQE